MLQIVVPAAELFDETNQQFIQTKETTLKLEHSLLSISKWESKWCKPFIVEKKEDSHTAVEMLDYIKCMTLNNNVNDDVYQALTMDNMKTINKYISSSMTATKIYDNGPKNGKNEIITSELIYYWMILYNIPFECEKWHLNRLITLIRVCSIKNNPKKMNKTDLVAQNRALNRARRKKLHTKG